MANSGVTVDELWRRCDRADQLMAERFRAIEDRASSVLLATVPREVYEERHLALRERVTNLEETAERALLYRRNMAIAIVGALVASLGAVAASLLAVTIH